MHRSLTFALLLLGSGGSCASAPGDVPSPTSPRFVLQGGALPGGAAADVAVRDGRIVAVGSVEVTDADEVVDVSGSFVAPAFIDSHVHLAYWEVAEELAAGGVAAALDLAAPLPFLAARPGPLQVLAAGPMITALDGYPTQSWGAGGYGLEVTDVEAAGAVDTLVDAGADVIKVPLQGSAVLSDEALASVVIRAHERERKVAVHALTDESARTAGTAGADVLAHTPVAALSPETLALWTDRAVISTLRAFGGSDDTVNNLTLLRTGGATVLYGTDLGNTRTAGIDPQEIALLQQAGLDGAAILRAGTETPAAYWGIEADLGAVAVGRKASLLVLDADPHLDPLALTRPQLVLIDGRPVGE